MTARLMLVEELVDANRALDELREKLTKAYVTAQRLNGNDSSGPLAVRIEALRQKVYDSKIDDELVALVKSAATGVSEAT